MLSLFVMLLIFTTIFPMLTSLMLSKVSLEKDYHAYRVADYIVTKRLLTDHVSSGEVQYDGEIYSWTGNRQRLCIYYLHQTQKEVCFYAQK